MANGILTADHDHVIDLDEAKALTRNHRRTAAAGSLVGGAMGRESLLALLRQDGCIGIRYYYGRHDDGTPDLVIVGIDENGSDITDGVILERIYPCPPYCDMESPLRSDSPQ